MLSIHSLAMGVAVSALTIILSLVGTWLASTTPFHQGLPDTAVKVPVIAVAVSCAILPLLSSLEL